MASTFGNVESLMTSLRVQALAQQITANNIANAASRGFSRQIPVLTSGGPMGLSGIGGLFRPGMGPGVTLSAISRVRDEYLDLAIRGERGIRGQQQAIRDAVNAMAILFPEIASTPGTGLVSAVGAFFADWTDVATGVPGARATLVTDAVAMTTLFHDADRTLAELQRITDGRVRDSITRINSLLGQIASANALIVGTGGGVNGSANAAMDARDLAITDLSELIKVDSVRLGDGSVMVVTGNARVLVRGGMASTLTATGNAHEPAFADVLFRDAAGGPAANISAELGGGLLRGQLIARDQILADERLELDELAHSLIVRVNELHRAGYAADGVTTGLDFFSVAPGMVPAKARDIAVNAAIVANPLLLAASRINGNGADVDQAVTLAALKNMLMNATVASTAAINLGGTIDPTVAMNSAVGTPLNVPGGSNAVNFAVPPAASGTLVINGVSIVWTDADSIDTIVGKINAAAGLNVRACFDYSSQCLHLYSDAPLTVYDDPVAGGNLTAVFKLQTRVQSLAPVNNGLGPLDRSLNLLSPLGSGRLEYRSPAGANGTVRLQWQAPAGTPNAITVAWNNGQDTATVLASLNGALIGAGAPFLVGFDPVTQTFSINGTGALPASQAAPISPIAWVDLTGNLGLAFNLEAQPSFATFTDALLAQMSATRDDAASVFDQADAAVTQLEFQQDAVAKVNIDEEKMRLAEYIRAYEASVRAMAALDEVLNTLINRMAASSFQGSPSSSVLTS